MEGVKSMEKLLLSPLLLGDELYIVYKQHVDVSVFFSEFLVLVVSDGIDKLVGERLAGGVKHFGVWIVIQYVMSYGVHKMGLAQTYAAVEEKRVVCLRRLHSHGQSRRVSHPVAVSYDKRAENIFRIEIA